MKTFLLALPFIGAAASADCWTVRAGRATLLASVDGHRYVCYQSDLLESRYNCFESAVLSGDEPVGHLTVTAGGVSTLELNVLAPARSVWDSELRYETTQVNCEKLTVAACARRLGAHLGFVP